MKPAFTRRSPARRMPRPQRSRFSTAALLALSSLTMRGSHAQVTITAADMFNQPGLYYRAYANNFDPLDPTGGTAYAVPSDLIGSTGPDQFWNFSNGPTDKILRFDYLSPANLPEAADFPEATVVEQETPEGTESHQWLFFQQVAGQGRTVYGFYAENPFFTPSNVFTPPIVDFPERIAYGDEWSTSTTYESTLSISDSDPEEGGIFDLGQRIAMTSNFKVDAYGTILLPDEIGTFGAGLRISEEETLDVSVDFGDGQFDQVETDYVRNYYWVMPGYGIVAQLNSTQSSTPPPPNFTRATSFLRLFETNKKTDTTGGGCTEPAPVSDLKIRVNGGVILMTWSKAECATQYAVQYSTDPANAASWKALGDPTPNAVWQGENIKNGPSRFYRVLSMR